MSNYVIYSGYIKIHFIIMMPLDIIKSKKHYLSGCWAQGAAETSTPWIRLSNELFLLTSLKSKYTYNYKTINTFNKYRDSHDRMVVAITTAFVASSNPAHREVYSIQYYVIKFVRDLRQVGSFLRDGVLLFLSLIKLTATTKLKYCWKRH